MIYRSVKKIVLASASPRRKMFLEEAGLDFTIAIPWIDETLLAGESPEDYVRRMAREKGLAVSAQCPDSWVVAADTIVALGNTIFGKPEDREDAVSMLRSLSGRRHRVMTCYSLSCKQQNSQFLESVETEVKFRRLSDGEIFRYVDTEEPADKAGAYGIQGLGGVFVEGITGSYSNVVGLPMAELIKALLIYEVISIR